METIIEPVLHNSNEYSYKDIELLKMKIVNTDTCHHIYILKILKDNNVDFSENKNGCFINMIPIPHDVLEKIEQYVDFLQDKDKNLDMLEKVREDMKKSVHDDGLCMSSID